MEALFHSLLFFLGLLSTSSVLGYLEIYPPVDVNDQRTSLHFALLQSFGGSYDGSGSVAGLRLALDRINSDSTLLPGYSLHYTLTDTRIISGPVKIAVIGSGCSVATEPTAEISHYYNITHISCVSTSTELANRMRFRYYFQLLPTAASIAPTYYGVIRHYEWRRVGLIVQNENLFTVTMDHLKEMLDTINVTYIEKNFESENGIAELQPEPFDPSIRIYIIATYAVHARSLLCEAYRLGLHYPSHLLLTYAWYAPNWWKVEDQSFPCTVQQRESMLNRSLTFLQYDFLQDRNFTTDTGITGEQYFDEEQNHLHVPPLYLVPLNFSQYCYDATWTLVYALNQTITELEENSTLNTMVWDAAGLLGNDTFPLEQFSYNNSVLLDVIFRHMQDTNFRGITGPVSFSDIGIRPANALRVMQYRTVPVNGSTELNLVRVATVLGSEEEHAFQHLPGESDNTMWPGGVPYDGVPSSEEVSVDLSLTVTFSVLATAGIAFALACLAFNFIFRNKTLIRLSSPNLNYLIGGGAIILYIDTYFFVIPTTNPQAVAVFCNLTPWLTALGYSLCYGTILTKMVRVYFIFDKPTPQKKKALNDVHLALGVLTLVSMDVIILLVYAIVEGVQGNLTAVLVSNRENPRDIEGELGVITDYFIFVCCSTARDIFLGILYGYKMVLQVIALVLAFSTSKVKVKGLDDTKYIAAAIYVTSIVLAVIIVSTYTLKDFVNAFPALFCTGFFIGTTFILGFVFVPKMVGLYQDPEGKTVFSRTDPSHANMAPTGDKDTIESLRRQVQELKNEIHDSTSPSKSQTQSVLQTSNTPIDEDLGGGGGCKDGERCKDGEVVPSI